MASNETLIEMASYLYDGGWRAGDLKALKKEYGLNEYTATTICAHLASFENGSY